MNPISESKLKALKNLLSTCSPEEISWISGYIYGIQDPNQIQNPVEIGGYKTKNITVLYGTESGNSKKLANQFSVLCKKEGIAVKVKSLEKYPLQDLEKEEYVLGIISTQGEGEPPISARPFFDSILQTENKLPHIKFGILALGDTSYPLFCKAGEDLDIRLNELGAERIIPLQKCDIDYESEAKEWFEIVLKTLQENSLKIEDQPPKKNFNTKRKTQGIVREHILLNDIGSQKYTYHIEIEPEEDLEYLPGDSLGIIPINSIQEVNKILESLQISASESIVYKETAFTLEEILKNKVQILFLPLRIIKKYSEIAQQSIPEIRMDLGDLLKIYPVKNDSDFLEFLGYLDPISPRLYSISSAPSAHDSRIHITVALDQFKIGEIQKSGHCSSYLAGIDLENSFPIYIHSNPNFRLPDKDKDLIMIGPGTGIAPFRSFLFERDSSLASGKNWLFFGDQHAQTDFLYQTEIQDFISSNVIQKINLAFSRDQSEKIYVQHLMEQESVEIMKWLEEGAYIYLCGTRSPMSEDVENTLIQIISQNKKLNWEEAKDYLEGLKEDGRYLKDVY